MTPLARALDSHARRWHGPRDRYASAAPPADEGRVPMDHATPNLPARDFAATARFYAALGFVEAWRDAGWMILARGDLRLEFFPFPDLDPYASAFGSCLRLDDLDDFYAAALAAGLPETTVGQPRLHRARVEASGLRIGALIDPDGSLLRLIQN